ncbi:MAG: hypothetical protein K0R25_1188 [Rickettsiaceae bacterium]|jgi:hypothetical protein|nr:hypothetical protein [Rickettsiaceae bacterium]
MKKIFPILTLLFLSNCIWFKGASTPFLAGTSFEVPEGTPLFKKGFTDGCGSILRNRSTGFYRDRYKYQYDPTLIDNPEYKFGYSRGWTNCFNYIVGGRHTLGGSADAYIYGGFAPGTSFSMGKGNVDSTINYEEGTWNNPFAIGGGGIDSMWGVVQQGNKGGGGTAFGGHPLWGTWQTGQIFGQ